MKCPKCGRDTYSKKWDQCTAIGCEQGREPRQNVSRGTLPVDGRSRRKSVQLRDYRPPRELSRAGETTWERIIRRFVPQ